MQLSYKIFPHTVRRGQVVAWTTIIYREAEMGPEFYRRMLPCSSPEAAHTLGAKLCRRVWVS
jgi:hypothetical protein